LYLIKWPGIIEELSVDAVADGHYYRKQIGCKSRIIAWSHGSRFKFGLRLVGQGVPKLLDYGCGDGTFLAMCQPHVQEAWGADLAADQIIDCRKRFASFANLHFCTIAELDASHNAAYPIITCMETLEHCTAPVVEVVLRDLARLVARDGRVIISVPIEIGPTFLLKAIIRKIAAWRGLSDYRYYESYTFRDSMRMIFARQSTTFERPVYGESNVTWHSHYGFNWRAMRQKVGEYFSVERTRFSPLGFLGGWFSSQAWFVCRPLRS
jgi:SAM-dependent methyltransferase